MSERLINENDIKKMGLKWINVNLSPIQFMRPDIGDKLLAIMKKYNVAWLDSSEFFGNELTWVYHYQDGQLKTEEYGGYDFTYLENYAF